MTELSRKTGKPAQVGAAQSPSPGGESLSSSSGRAERQLGPATRDAYGQVLLELGRENPDVVVLDADLSKSTMSGHFARQFPERFFNFGIAESNMIGAAAGLAVAGKIPFASSFACFLLGNAFEQIRVSVAYPHLNVKLVGSHSGISGGEDGASQQAVEDLALASTLAGFTVLAPADAASARAAVRAAAAHEGPVYLRMGRPKAPVVYPEGCVVEIGRALRPRQGRDLTIVACGLLVSAALDAAEQLRAEGIDARVLDMVSVKPLDEDAILEAAEETGRIVVAEEHLLWGGLGSAVAMVVARRCPVPMAFVGLDDCYGFSASAQQLLDWFGLSAEGILSAARSLLERPAHAPDR